MYVLLQDQKKSLSLFLLCLAGDTVGTYLNLSWERMWCSKMSVISTVGRSPNSSNMNCLTEAQNPTTKCTLFTTINVFSSVEVDIENNGLHLLICTWTLALGKKEESLCTIRAVHSCAC